MLVYGVVQRHKLLCPEPRRSVSVTHGRRNAPLVRAPNFQQLTNCLKFDTVLEFLHYQQLPTVKFSKPCVLITIRIAGWVYHPHSSLQGELQLPRRNCAAPGREQRELLCLDAIQRGLRSCALVASRSRRRGRAALARSSRQERLGLRYGKSISVVRGLNATQEILITDGRKVELCFAVGRLLRLGEKRNKVGAIFVVDKKQDSGLVITEPDDFVFAGGERLAGGHEGKRYLHQDPIRGLGPCGTGEASEAGHDQKNAQECFFHRFSFVRFGVVAGKRRFGWNSSRRVTDHSSNNRP